MSSKHFLYFADKGLLNLRNLLEENETMLNDSRLFAPGNRREQGRQKRIRHVYNEDEKSDSATLFGVPLILVILIAALFITIVACTAIAIYCWCENSGRKECQPEPKEEEEKEEDDKNIEMSQVNKDENCGHIIINSL